MAELVEDRGEVPGGQGATKAHTCWYGSCGAAQRARMRRTVRSFDLAGERHGGEQDPGMAAVVAPYVSFEDDIRRMQATVHR